LPGPSLEGETTMLKSWIVGLTIGLIDINYLIIA
jgi:hypothetical protein